MYQQNYGGPPPVNDQIAAWFYAVDQNDSGRIDQKELQMALSNGAGQRFEEHTCRSLIQLFSVQKIDTIDMHEFSNLFQFINHMVNLFRSFDRNGSGSIDEYELGQALQQMGYRLSPGFIRAAVSNSKDGTRMQFDEFIVCMVKLQLMTNEFMVKDVNKTGSATFGYEEFLAVMFRIR